MAPDDPLFLDAAGEPVTRGKVLLEHGTGFSYSDIEIPRRAFARLDDEEICARFVTPAVIGVLQQLRRQFDIGGRVNGEKVKTNGNGGH